ncbi:MAG TPA: DNA methyltransferase [Chloroflexota bacterium]|nr:DNA methyltransferase [Chloroflexota bacterium]
MIEPIQPLLLPDEADLSARAPAPGRARPGKGLGGAKPAKAQGQRDKHPKNSLNELSGDEWIFFTKSVLTTAYASEYGHALRRAHGANKPPQLMKSLIEFFTKADGRVLDPFAGVGGTLIGASIASPARECVGIEINPRWAEVYRRVVRQSGGALCEYPLHEGDSLQLLEDRDLFPDQSFDFICTDPPYNVHLEQTMANDRRYTGDHANRRTDYNMRSEAPQDLANLSSYEAYLDSIQQAIRGCFRVLKHGKYLAIILRNAYQGGRYVFTHVDVARRAELEGFVVKGETIWYQVGTRLRPYGYPYAYIPNITHQHIVFLQKPVVSRTRRQSTLSTVAGGAAQPSTAI